MPDNTPQNGTATISTDEVTTVNGATVPAVQVQRVKNVYGDDGIARDVSETFPLPVDVPNATQTGTIAANGAAVTMTVRDGHSAFFIYIAGTFSAGTTLALEGSYDGTNWIATNSRRSTSAATNDLTNTYAADFTGPGPYFGRGNLAGFRFFRVVATAFAAGDSVAVNIATTAGLGGTFQLNTMDVRAALEMRTTGTASGNINTTYAHIQTASATTNVQLIAAPAAGLSIYITDMEGSNAGAAALLSFLAGAAGTASYARFLAANGGGFVTNLRTPWKLPAATALSYRLSVASSIHVTINYYIAP